MTQFRDLTLIGLGNNNLAIACDVSAGIGHKQLDEVQIDPAISAAYSLRVPLLELLCFGATPIAVVDTIGNEMESTGKTIINGLKSELQLAGLDIPLNGSTEDNMVTQTTSVGVTVIGQYSKIINNLPLSHARIYQIGKPLVGEEVKANLADIFSYDLVKKIRDNDQVVDMIPVGSKGIAYEVNEMAKTHGLTVDLELLQEDSLHKSAGPATVVLVAIDGDEHNQFEREFPEAKYLLNLDKGVNE